VTYVWGEFECSRVCAGVPPSFDETIQSAARADISYVFPEVMPSLDCATCGSVVWSFSVRVTTVGSDGADVCARATTSPGRLVSSSYASSEALCGDVAEAADCVVGDANAYNPENQLRFTAMAEGDGPEGWLRIETAIFTGSCPLTCP